MATGHESNNYDDLLAEVERTLGSSSSARPTSGQPADTAPAARRDRGRQPEPTSARSSDSAPKESGSRLARGISRGVVAGAATAAVVWVGFFFLPYLGAWSGAAGAVIAAFLTPVVRSFTSR